MTDLTDIYDFDRFVGNLLKGQTVGVIGAGRIISAYARMMVSSSTFAPDQTIA